MRFLMLTLYAPLTSWGDIAVGEIRSSWDRPSRSAILGLCAAALGYGRGAQDEHDALSLALGLAIRLDAPGVALTDYHTAQTISASDIRRARPRTRRQLLQSGSPQTILSRRTLRQDTLATAAIWARAPGAPALEEIAERLAKPHYTLYAGRKANALGLPLQPRITEAANLAAAFAQRPPLPPELAAAFAAIAPSTPALATEITHDIPSTEQREILEGLTPVRTEMRRDDSPHRGRWHFTERAVAVSLLHLPEASP